MRNKKNFFLLVGILFLGMFSPTIYANTEDLPQIMIDSETKTIYVTTGSFQNTTITETPAITGTITNTGNNEIVEEVIVDDNLNEFQQALAWMYANGLTQYNTEELYRPHDFVIREEATKMLGQAYAVLGYSQIAKKDNCTFSDAENFDPSLVDHIKYACQRGLFKGYEGNFMPKQTLTQPQSMAVLIRMFEGEFSEETRTPRWELYYLKGRRIGIIDSSESITNYNQPITREALAIAIFRLKNIIYNEQLKLMSLNAVEQVNNENNNVSASDLSSNLSSLGGSIDASSDPELQEAVAWMHDKGITNFGTISEYKPFETLTREQAAKMVNQFAELFDLKTTTQSLGNECTFTDIDQADPNLKPHIEEICKYGFLKGGNGLFNPKGIMNKSQFVTALIRMIEGSQNETGTPWRTQYFERARALGIVGPADAVTFNSPITRYEVALFLYRLKIKYKMLQSLNNNRMQNEIISTVAGSIMTGLQGGQEANIYLDANLINDGNFEIGFVELFGTRYKVVKTDIQTYFTNGFVRYGNLYDLVTDEKIGTINFILTNNIVIEGTIRHESNNKNYDISLVSNTAAYYHIKEQQ